MQEKRPPIATIQYGGIFSCIPPICIQARSKKRSEPECENHQQSTLSSTWNSYSSDNKAAPSALCRFSSSNILMWSWIRYSFIEIHLQICFFLSLVRFVRILVGLGQRTSLVLVLCLGWGWSSQSLDMRPHDMVTVFVRKLCYSLNQTLSFVHNMLSFSRTQLWWSDTNSEQRFID